MSGIVVGVDGSDGSGHALGWAMREAALRHVPLTVMTVRPGPAQQATLIFWGLRTLPEGGLSHEQARAGGPGVSWPRSRARSARRCLTSR